MQTMPPLRLSMLVLAIGVCACITFGAYQTRVFPVDDTYIHLSYGLNPSLGHFFSFNGIESDSGTSSWAWTTLCMVVVRLGLNPYVALTTISIAVFAATLWLSFDLARRALPPSPLREIYTFVPVGVTVVCGNILWLSLTGMETGFGILILMLLVRRTLSRQRLDFVTGLIAVVAIWTRLEAIFWLALLFGYLLIKSPRKINGFALLPLGGLAASLAYNQRIAHAWLPTSGMAKAATYVPSHHNWPEEKSFLVGNWEHYLAHFTPGIRYTLAAGSLAFFIALITWSPRASRRNQRVAAGARTEALILFGGSAIHACANLIQFRSGYHHLRYFAPLLFFSACVAPTIVAIAAQQLAERTRLHRHWLIRVTTGFTLLFCASFAGSREREQFRTWSKIYRENAKQLESVHLQVGSYLGGLDDAKRVACFDVGAIRWASKKILLDLGGTTSPLALEYLRNKRLPQFLVNEHADYYISLENGWDHIPNDATKMGFSLEPVKTWQYPEYGDPYPPHSSRMVLFKVNHCDEPSKQRKRVGSPLSFETDGSQPTEPFGSGEGNAFDNPITDKPPNRRGANGRGKFLSSFAANLGDRATGTFSVRPFEVAADWLSFRFAGGYDPRALRIELLIDERRVAEWSGFNSDSFVEATFAIGNYRGRTAKLVVIDKSKGSWGHLLLDDVYQYDWETGPITPCYRPSRGPKR